MKLPIILMFLSAAFSTAAVLHPRDPQLFSLADGLDDSPRPQDAPLEKASLAGRDLSTDDDFDALVLGVVKKLGNMLRNVAPEKQRQIASKLLKYAYDKFKKEKPIDTSMNCFMTLGKAAEKNLNWKLSEQDIKQMVNAFVQFSNPALEKRVGKFGLHAVSTVKGLLGRSRKTKSAQKPAQPPPHTRSQIAKRENISEIESDAELWRAANGVGKWVLAIFILVIALLSAEVWIGAVGIGLGAGLLIDLVVNTIMDKTRGPE
jgi:hypothetical protein